MATEATMLAGGRRTLQKTSALWEAMDSPYP